MNEEAYVQYMRESGNWLHVGRTRLIGRVLDWFFPPTANGESSQVADALNRLSIAMEKAQASYDATQRANRRVRIALIVVLLLLGGAAYQALAPWVEQIAQIAHPRPAFLDPEAALAERQRLLEMLPPEERERVELFETQIEWLS